MWPSASWSQPFPRVAGAGLCPGSAPGALRRADSTSGAWTQVIHAAGSSCPPCPVCPHHGDPSKGAAWETHDTTVPCPLFTHLISP